MRFDIKDYYRMFLSYGFKLPYKYFLESHLFDILRSTDTHTWRPKEFEEIYLKDRNFGVHYQASWTSEIKKSFKFIYNLIGKELENYQFIDAGCGKGKPCFVYSEQAQKENLTLNFRIIGLDYSPEMINIANKNKKILIYKKYIKPQVRIKFICEDISNIKNHIESKNVIVYMYNPFISKVLIRFLEEIHNYNLFIIYNNPMELNVLKQFGLKVLNYSSGFHPSSQTCILTNSPKILKY